MFVVTTKEIRLLLRSRMAFGFVLAALLVMGAVFCLAWASMSHSYYYYSAGTRSRLGRDLFFIISFTQLCAMGLTAPLTAASAVSGEREAGTLDLLFCTGLSRLNILFGKWAATVYYELVLLICTLPVLSLVFLLGGVGPDDYFFSALMIAASVLAYGMLGLACSCLFRRSIAALAAALLTVLFLACFWPMLLLVLDEMHVIDINQNYTGTYHFHDALFWSVSPLVAWIRRMDSGMSARAALFKDPYFLVHLGFQFLVFMVSLALARRAFRRLGSDGTDASLQKLAETAHRRRWPFLRFLPQVLGAAAFLLRPVLRLRPQHIPDGVNPIYGRARSVYPWRRLLAQMAFFSIPVALLLSDAWDDPDADDFVAVTVIYAITLVGLFTPIFSATAIAREHDEKTMDLLRVTPLTAGAIVRGKFLAALRPLLAIALMAALIPLLFRRFSTLDQTWFFGLGRVRRTMVPEFLFPAARVAVLLVLFTAFYTAVSIYLSTFQRRGAGAMILAYIVLFILAVAGPFVLALIAYELGGDDWGDKFGMMVVFHHQLKVVAAAVSPLLSPYYYLAMTDSNVRHAYVFWGQDKMLPDCLMLMEVHAGLMLGLTWLALRGAASRLARR